MSHHGRHVNGKANGAAVHAPPTLDPVALAEANLAAADALHADAVRVHEAASEVTAGRLRALAEAEAVERETLAAVEQDGGRDDALVDAASRASVRASLARQVLALARDAEQRAIDARADRERHQIASTIALEKVRVATELRDTATAAFIREKLRGIIAAVLAIRADALAVRDRLEVDAVLVARAKKLGLDAADPDGIQAAGCLLAELLDAGGSMVLGESVHALTWLPWRSTARAPDLTGAGLATALVGITFEALASAEHATGQHRRPELAKTAEAWSRSRDRASAIRALQAIDLQEGEARGVEIERELGKIVRPVEEPPHSKARPRRYEDGSLLPAPAPPPPEPVRESAPAPAPLVPAAPRARRVHPVEGEFILGDGFDADPTVG